MIFCGIDPGLTGAIAFIDSVHGLIAVDDLPTMPIDGVGPDALIKLEIDVQALRRIVRSRVPAGECSIFLMEHSGAFGKGAASAASLEASKASILAVLRLGGFDVRRIGPVRWQKFYGIKKDAVGAASKDTGEQSRLHAVNLYGLQYFTRKKDHNRADAALIARYALRHFA